ncbi:hypothetical protein CRI94_16735 [Longibacter salinarum]|uniref:Uncharacterized protein n=1 Tax=Longibacter salinarum TaxID=1850348 RepID=A0A2A8CTG2_9BACT|nr:hypothetical protein [Longibacter salinarum]PEN11067.1 hypothetical protein CRI94_16735 [Longibacter salinarum]
MKRFLSLALAAIGAWVLVSFGGAMIDTARAEFWTQSLMWSLVTTLVLAPVLILMSTRSDTKSAEPETQPEAEKDQPDAFVPEESDRMRSLWPEDASKKGDKEVA